MLSQLHPVSVIHGSTSFQMGGNDHWPIQLTWLSSSSLPLSMVCCPMRPYRKTSQVQGIATSGARCTSCESELDITFGGLQSVLGLCPIRCRGHPRHFYCIVSFEMLALYVASHVASKTDIQAVQWLHTDCKAARAKTLQEEAHPETTAEQSTAESCKTDYLLKVLQHWRCHQWAGQPGISSCSTLATEERRAIEAY
eukprot:5935834-Amphidinium_carterae.4